MLTLEEIQKCRNYGPCKHNAALTCDTRPLWGLNDLLQTTATVLSNVLHNITHNPVKFCLLPSPFLLQCWYPFLTTFCNTISLTQNPEIHSPVSFSSKTHKGNWKFPVRWTSLNQNFHGSLNALIPITGINSKPYTLSYSNSYWTSSSFNTIIRNVSLLRTNTVKDKHTSIYGLHLPWHRKITKAHHSTLCCEIWTRIYLKWFSWTQQKAHYRGKVSKRMTNRSPVQPYYHTHGVALKYAYWPASDTFQAQCTYRKQHMNM